MRERQDRYQDDGHAHGVEMSGCAASRCLRRLCAVDFWERWKKSAVIYVCYEGLSTATATPLILLLFFYLSPKEMLFSEGPRCRIVLHFASSEECR